MYSLSFKISVNGEKCYFYQFCNILIMLLIDEYLLGIFKANADNINEL